MGARNESRATGVIAKLKADGYLDDPKSGEVLWHELDLTTPVQAKRSAEEFMKRETRLDVPSKCRLLCPEYGDGLMLCLFLS